MAVAGALFGKYVFDAFGRKPDIPTLPEIRPGEVQRDTVAENLAALPEAGRLASAVNRFRRQEGEEALRRVGAGGLLEEGTGQIRSFIRGEIPEGVGQQVEQSAAQRALAGGFGGSGMANAMTARDLGLTSLDLVQRGLGSAQSWLQGALQLSQPGGFADPTSMFFSPQERLQFEERDRAMRFQRNLLAEQVEAAPDPADVALAREVDRFWNTAAQVGMSYAGGGMGGGMGGAGGMMGGMMGG